jgi:hypothetical protein
VLIIYIHLNLVEQNQENDAPQECLRDRPRTGGRARAETGVLWNRCAPEGPHTPMYHLEVQPPDPPPDDLTTLFALGITRSFFQAVAAKNVKALVTTSSLRCQGLVWCLGTTFRTHLMI